MASVEENWHTSGDSDNATDITSLKECYNRPRLLQPKLGGSMPLTYLLTPTVGDRSSKFAIIPSAIVTTPCYVLR